MSCSVAARLCRSAVRSPLRTPRPRRQKGGIIIRPGPAARARPSNSERAFWQARRARSLLSIFRRRSRPARQYGAYSPFLDTLLDDHRSHPMIGLLVLFLTLSNGDISGVVRDPTGAVVPGASVIARGAAGEQRALTGSDGRFTVATTEGDVVLVVRAEGFAEKHQPAAGGARDVEVVLAPAALLENVTVTASRTEQRLGDVPESVSVLRSEEIRQSPAVVADDVLRQVPTFS